MSMQVVSYNDPREFLQKTQAYLEREEVKNGLMLGVVTRLINSPETVKQKPYLGTVEDAKGLALAAMITPPFNLVLYSDRPEAEREAVLKALAAGLPAAGFNPPGVTAPIDLALPFAYLWTTHTDKKLRLKHSMRVFELREVVWPNLPAGKFRVAEEKDITLLSGYFKGFEEDAGMPISGESYEAAARGWVARGDIFVWQDETGQVVSMAAKSRPTERGVTVSLVYTPPELRGRGYAGACVATLSQFLLDQGYQYCTLFTDLANPVSNSIYQKMGYKPVCDFAEYAFD